MPEVQSSREEAQTAIYRGCARLAKAMQIKRVSGSAAKKWEDGALQEVRAILAAAGRGAPLSDLVIPPLPIALLEVRRRLPWFERLGPSDIHSPFKQASKSPWAVWLTQQDYPQIPSDIDLGDPSTFWWKDMEEERPTIQVEPVAVACKVVDSVSDDNSSTVDLTLCSTPASRSASTGPSVSRRDRTSVPTAKRLRTDDSEPDQSSTHSDSERAKNKVSKRCRIDSTNDSEDWDEEPVGEYDYVPKCDSCKDRGIACHVNQQGEVCIPCRHKKCRCSAYRGSNYVTGRRTSAIFGEGGPAKEPEVERAAAARHSPNSQSSRTRSSTTPPIPRKRFRKTVAVVIPTSRIRASTTRFSAKKRILVDKSVATESQPNERPNDVDADFRKVLVSVISDAVRLHQHRASPVDGSRSAPSTSNSISGRSDDHVEFVKELMSLMFEVVESRWSSARQESRSK